MKINLLPPELQPTRPSPIPYMPLLGLAALSVIWLITQFAIAAGARGVTGTYHNDFVRVSKELGPTRQIPAQLEEAEAGREALKFKALTVTELTQNACSLSPVFHAFARTMPKTLRLTNVAVDLIAGTATVTGYGSENNADVEVATFIRSLDTQKEIGEILTSPTLNYCQNAKRAGTPVKEFAISFKFHDRFIRPPEFLPTPAGKETNGSKNRP